MFSRAVTIAPLFLLPLFASFLKGQVTNAGKSRLTTPQEVMHGMTSIHVVFEYTAQNDTLYEDPGFTSYMTQRCKDAGINVLPGTYPQVVKTYPLLRILFRRHNPGTNTAYMFGIMEIRLYQGYSWGTQSDGTKVIQRTIIWSNDPNYIYVNAFVFDRDIRKMMDEMIDSFISDWKKAN